MSFTILASHLSGRAAEQAQQAGGQPGASTSRTERPSSQPKTPTKRTAEGNLTPGNSPAKHSKETSMDTVPQGDVPMVDAPVAARDGSISNSAQGGMRGQAPLPPGIRQGKTTYTRTFTRQYNWRIFNQLAEYRTPTIGGVSYNAYVPPFHDIPCDLLAFYLNFADIQRLRSKTKVVGKSYRVSVSNHTAIITYETNASGTQIGNNNLGVTMAVLDDNIHKYRTGRAVTSAQGDLVQNLCWGIDANSLPATNTLSSALQGLSSQYITRNFNNRYEYLTPRANVTRLHNGLAPQITPMQFFNVNRFIKKRVNVSMQEGVIAEWSHTPTNGLLFARNLGTYAPGGLDTNAFCTAHEPVAVRGIVNSSSTGMQNQVAGAAPTAAFNIVGNFYNDVFENESNVLRINIESNFNGQVNTNKPAVLTLGLEPQIAINTDNSPAVAIPLHVDLIITAECVLEITEGTDYCDANYGRLEEMEWKFPNYRTYRTDATTGEPTIIQNAMHQEFPNAHEIPFNSTSINRGVPTAWPYSPIIATAAEESAVLDESMKTINENYVEYYPYMTRSLKKKLEGQSKTHENTTAKAPKRVERSMEYLSDEENLN